MPIIGLASGIKVKCSQQQYDSFMKRREPYMDGAFVQLHDENRNPVGKIRPAFIEYIAPDNSTYFGVAEAKVETKPFVPAPKTPAVSYKNKKYDKKKV